MEWSGAEQAPSPLRDKRRHTANDKLTKTFNDKFTIIHILVCKNSDNYNALMSLFYLSYLGPD